MSARYIYAARLPDGNIKFGVTDFPQRRFQELRWRYGKETKVLGTALGGYSHEAELRRLLIKHRVKYPSQCDREIFRPAPIVMRVVSMMRSVDADVSGAAA